MKHIKLYEDFLNEATVSWSSMMKGVRAEDRRYKRMMNKTYY